jgi:hypothetical protein
MSFLIKQYQNLQNVVTAFHLTNIFNHYLIIYIIYTLTDKKKIKVSYHKNGIIPSVK